MKITGKLIMIVLMAIGGTAFVVSRLVLSVINKTSVNSLINAIKKNPSKASEVAASLDIPYSYKEMFLKDHYEHLKTYVQSVSTVGSYRILHVACYDTDHILAFTELEFTDFDINVTGGASDTKKKSFHSFVLRFEKEKNKLIVLSNIYSDVTEKFQKEGFMNAVLQGT